MLGTRALQIFDETVCVVRAVDRWTDFYKHESCGKCTPCREGTWWLKQILERLEHGKGTEEDLDKLLDICDNILGRSFCALGDGATSPITSIQYFREEYLATLPARRVLLRPGRTRCCSPRTRRACPHDRHDRQDADGEAGGAEMVDLTIDGLEVSVPRAPSSSGPPSRSASRSRASATTRAWTRSAPAGSASSRSRCPDRGDGTPVSPGRCRAPPAG
jgi:hypothetical protein